MLHHGGLLFLLVFFFTLLFFVLFLFFLTDQHHAGMKGRGGRDEDGIGNNEAGMKLRWSRRSDAVTSRLMAIESRAERVNAINRMYRVETQVN